MVFMVGGTRDLYEDRDGIGDADTRLKLEGFRDYGKGHVVCAMRAKINLNRLAENSELYANLYKNAIENKKGNV